MPKIKLYNTLSRKKDDLQPIHADTIAEKGWVGLYTCGPTVYNFAHIGNLRTYIFEDILHKTLEYNGHEVRRVMNITDVGHLTGDSDAGDDKLDKEARTAKKSVEEIAQFYTDAFFADFEKLNIKKPDIIAPATKFVNEQIAVIQVLIEKGFAYQTPAAVYFDVSKFPNYGKLSGQSLDDKLTGARGEVVVDGEKRNAADFALWFKLEGKFKNHLLHWASPWGEGFPGWHIECSAIARQFLGQPFDIHTGGVDHIGTHHTNEIAQSEAAFDVPLAHIWMHGEHLLVDGKKMAKSEGNFFTLADLENRGYHPMVFRYLMLTAHYRTQLNFTWESLEAAKNGIERLYRAIYDYTFQIHQPDYDESKLNPGKEKQTLEGYEKSFLDAVNDDLNTPQALAITSEMIADHGSSTKKLELIAKFDHILGLSLEVPINEYLAEKPAEIVEKQRKYDECRTNKQFVQSDALRKEMEDLGYTVRDMVSGSYIVKRFF